MLDNYSARLILTENQSIHRLRGKLEKILPKTQKFAPTLELSIDGNGGFPIMEKPGWYGALWLCIYLGKEDLLQQTQ